MAVVGIDLGTTNSLIAVWQNDQATLIPNIHGETLTPSVVSVDTNGEILVGKAAKERLITHPESSIEAFKRKMGTNAVFNLSRQKFTPVELSTLILKSLKADAEAFLNEEVTEAVISVPAYFNDVQRNATKVAGEMAGLKVERLINEPTAAAAAYGLHDREDDSTFMVVDLGGGTFDVSIMELFNDVMEVHASAGDTFLGGEDFTSAIQQSIVQDCGIVYDALSAHEKTQLRALANLSKLKLSEQQSIEIDIPLKEGTKQWQFSRDKFAEKSEPLLNRLRAPIERVLRDSDIKPAELSDVLLVGGATRMPIIRSTISKMFRRVPSGTINPDQVVAIGAAIQASLKNDSRPLKDVVLTDVCPYTLGVEIVREHHHGQYEEGHFMPILERNTVIPVSKVERVYTVADNQKHLALQIYQGESRLVKNNLLLGKLDINVPQGKAGEQSVDIRFTYDVNGILEVEATVNSTGEHCSTIIEKSPGSISQQEIQASLKKLQTIKIHPRETQQNRAAIARAERIYEQSLGDTRHYISHLISEFEAILAQQDLKKADQARNELMTELDKLDGNIF
ncbi:Chaperone protein HscC [Thalassocella blandensis]|nr:Chaperone protein HscC [Thalassocella blandensis]